MEALPDLGAAVLFLAAEAPDFLAVDFFVVDFFVVDFFVVDFPVVGFLVAGFFFGDAFAAADFFAGAAFFFAAGFFAAAFFAAGFFEDVFLVAGFFGAAFFAAGFFPEAFAADAFFTDTLVFFDTVFFVVDFEALLFEGAFLALVFFFALVFAAARAVVPAALALLFAFALGEMGAFRLRLGDGSAGRGRNQQIYPFEGWYGTPTPRRSANFLGFRPHGLVAPTGGAPTLAPMNSPSLWDRVRRARMVQVLAVYLGASWVVLQIADTLSEALALPSWVSPVTIILLLVGLLIITATAWVQSLPATTAAEEAGELPTDWEIAPADVVESLRSGRLPHLTWGRAIFGGVFALALLFGGTGLWVTLTGGPGLFGPTEVGASDAAEGIAILPFSVSGIADEPFWGEGMVDLLSTNLDGMGGYRTIDSRTVLARWRERVGDAETPDLDVMLRAAGETGARYAVVGSSVGIGDQVRLTADIYDLADAREIGSGQVDGSQAQPMRLIDDLSLETMRRLLAGGGEELATSRNLADLTTSSVPALRAYLEGERYYRQAEFPRAVEAYERALQADSTFALALFRISDAYGWLESVLSETAIELGAKSVRYMDRLSPRNAIIVAAGNALYVNDLTYVGQLEEAVRKYPDDPEAWFMLGEMYIHMGEATGSGAREALDAVMRAIELDPAFAPYYVHAIDQSMALGEVDEARRLIDRYRAFSETAGLQAEYVAAMDFYYGDADARAAAWAALDDLEDTELQILWGTFGTFVDDLASSMELAAYMHRRLGQDGWATGRAQYGIAAGMTGFVERMVGDSLPDPAHPMTIYLTSLLTDIDVGDRIATVRRCEPGRACSLWRGALAAEAGDWDDLAAMIASQRAAAEQLRAAGDSITARFPEAEAIALEGYGQFLRGELLAARATLARAQGISNGNGDIMARYWLARVNEEAGRPQDALHWYGLLRTTPLRTDAFHRRARIAEQVGDTETALASWRVVAAALGGADPGHPLAAEASSALERLGG